MATKKIYVSYIEDTFNTELYPPPDKNLVLRTRKSEKQLICFSRLGAKSVQPL